MAVSITTQNITDVNKMYVALFGRAPDGVGLGYWARELAGSDTVAPKSLATVANTMFATDAARAYYPSALTNQQIVDNFYLNVLGRASDAAGSAYWTAALNKTGATPGSVIVDIVAAVTNWTPSGLPADAATDAAGTISKNLFANKLEVSTYFGNTNGSIAAAQVALSGVTNAAATVTAAKASIDAVTATSGGSTFTLTTNAETFTGTSFADTFNGDITTMNVSDVITGGDGIDTLNFTGTTNVALPAASITGVEIINVRQTTLALANTDLSLVSGETTVNLDRSNQAATFTNMASGGAYGVIGNASVSNTGALAIGYVAAATASILNFSGGTLGAQAVTLTGTGLLSQTINSTGAANVTGAFTGAATATSTTINATTGLTTGASTNLGATVTVTGAGAVNLSANALEAGVTTFNASTNTGGVTVALGTLVTQTVTGSAGADTITSGAVLTTGSVNAGDGTDVLVIGANVAHVNTTSLAAKYTNFETLRMSGTLDMALISGITAVQVTNAATLTNLSATQAANIQIRTNNADGTGDAQSFALATATGNSDTLSLTMGTGSTTSSATDIAALTVTGFEILNIATNAGPTSTAGAGGALDRTTTVASLTGATLNTINLTGTAVNIANVATTVAVTVNGTALTGNGLAAATTAGLTVGGNAVAGSTINGSAVRDVLVIGAEGSAYNGNAGNDAITTTIAVLVADGVTDGTINGGDGTDTLTVSDTTTTLTDNHFTKLSNMEALALTSTGAADHSVTIGGTFNAAYANGATITTGTLAAGQDFTFAGGLASVPITLTVDATSLVGTAAETHSLVTGSAADTVTFTGDDTYVGVAGATGSIVISTAAGNDTINLTYGTLLANTTSMTATITGGTGADTITKVGTNGTGATARTQFTMASGSTGVTTTTFDRITGFDVADGTNVSDILDFAGVGAVGTLGTSTDFGTILSHSITTGYASFSTAATFATATVINATNLADVVGYLAANTATLDAVGFAFDSNSDGVNDSTLVYTNQASDGLVMLVGITTGTLNATIATVTAATIAIS